MMNNHNENNVIKREKFEAAEESGATSGADDVGQNDQPVATRTRRLSSNAALEAQQDLKPSIAKITIKQRNMIDGAITAKSTTITRNMQQQQQQQQQPNPNSIEVPALTTDEVTKIYLRDPSERSEQDNRLLAEYSFLIPAIKARIKYRLDKELLKQRVMEHEEPLDIVEEKTNRLVGLIKSSRHIVIYTGAGISTSASIPDYRGPNGLWTQIRRAGSFSITKLLDLSKSEPTYTHMAIRELTKRRLVKHVVSQNCDGLHLRSGINQQQLSEIHGNMYIEVCPTCERQYFRQADVTGKTSRFRHKTGRKCHGCPEPNNNLIDTIVLYGERSRTKWPMNWERASKAAKKADLIICMGSSLKTLRRYGCLWPKSSSSKKEPETKLVIINLQYTPKDKMAVLKINAKCDLVMQLIMQQLKIDVPLYDWTRDDPLLKVAVPFTPEERTNLNRNLIFETTTTTTTTANSKRASPDNQDQSGHKKAKSEPRCSPSLFVSELTDDPGKKGLRMRIRAVNVGATGSNDGSFNGLADEHDDDDASQSAASMDDNDDRSQDDEANNDSIDDCTEEEYNENARLQGDQQHRQRQGDYNLQTSMKQSAVNKVEYVIPGWLGKSIGATRSGSYRRKRHGNKGRKHSSGHLKAPQSTSHHQPEQQSPSLGMPTPSQQQPQQQPDHIPTTAMVKVASEVV